jgi:hypothetical protein
MVSYAVFDEQRGRINAGTMVCSIQKWLIASIYQATSSHFQVAAHKMALEYEIEANELNWSHLLDCDFSDYQQRKPFETHSAAFLVRHWGQNKWYY